jgi:branched-chain amino acid transport system ATP-binding protein
VLIKLDEIHTFIGKSHILHGVSLDVIKGESVGLLGRNGVGKSTTMKSIMGMSPPQRGSIRYNGKEIIGLRPYEICQLGIGYVPEDRRVFSNLTLRQNLMIGMKPNQRCEDSWTIEKIYHYFPQLEKRDRVKAGNLSGGEQQMLTIGRTLMGNPELLLVDEPTEGLSPILVEAVARILRQINEKGQSILIVAQAMDVVLALVKQVYVMAKGMIVFAGTKEELQDAEEVRTKYLEF